MRLALRWKILLLVVVAPLTLAAGSLVLVRERVSENARTEIRDGLQRAALVCQDLLGARLRALEVAAQVVTRDPRFIAVLALPATAADPAYRATVRGVAREFRRVAEADVFDVLDPTGRPVASVGHASLGPEARDVLLSAWRGGDPVPGVIPEGEVLHQVTLHAVQSNGRTVGFLVLGSAVDDFFADDLRRLTRSEVSFVVEDRLIGSTLAEEESRRALLGSVSPAVSPLPDLLHAGVFELSSREGTMLTLVRTVPGSRAAARTLVVLQRSLDLETAFLRVIQRELRELGLLTVVAALLVGLLVSRMITRPIQRLVRGAEEMEKGRYDYPLGIRTKDELGYLAERFDEMRRHQRSYIESLRDVARLKSEFIDVASHELRTPAAVIRGYVELLGDGAMGRLTKKQRDALRAIEENLVAIVRIAENATWMAQIEGEQPVLDRAGFEVAGLVQDAVRAAALDAEGRRVEVRTEVAPGLRGVADRGWVEQAVAALVRNGIRFTPDGGSVTVRAQAAGDDLVIEIEDTGVGIAEEKLAHLFDRSFLVRDSRHHHSSSRLDFNSAGLGLGLPIARGIVEAHGGTIEVASRAGEGSRFTIRLPGARREDLSRAA